MEISGRFHVQGSFGMNTVAAVITAGTETISFLDTEQPYNSPTLIDVYQNFSLFVHISAPTLDWWVGVPLAIQSSLSTLESLSSMTVTVLDVADAPIGTAVPEPASIGMMGVARIILCWRVNRVYQRNRQKAMG
jgi:hypothetical protein